ncbi:hypothetical protein DL93DRAFT_2089821 [Clavulina sp. PMI_390]|nr:hypothetical protein DL93DRAFT_2089821 [Clavulina sp. PMI_390]
MNGTEIGGLDSKSYQRTILVHITHDLPSLHAVTLSAALARLGPSALIVLDTYPGPSYISSQPYSPLNLPVRFLGSTTTNLKPPSTPTLQHFEPPNLIQGLSAALIGRLESDKLSRADGTSMGQVILLPSLRIPPPPPRKEPRPVLSSLASSDEWTDGMLGSVAPLIGSHIPWDPATRSLARKQSGAPGAASKGFRRSAAGDVGMYV